MTRTLPASLAPVVEDLELDQSELVTLQDLTDRARRLGVQTSPAVLAHRLRQRGWLLATGQRGVWEFAPGAHAGPYGHGDPMLALRAAVAAHPDLRPMAALGSALWAHGLSDRAPDRHEIAILTGQRAPAGLQRAARCITFDATLPPKFLFRVPVHSHATILVHLAARPTDVRSWSAIAEAMPGLLDEATPEEIRTELVGRPAATSTRLAYLIHGLTPDLAADIARPGHGKVWFGPRAALRRHNAEFDIADTVLPFDPAELSRSVA